MRWNRQLSQNGNPEHIPDMDSTSRVVVVVHYEPLNSLSIAAPELCV
jgi:hypothetical protein